MQFVTMKCFKNSMLINWLINSYLFHILGSCFLLPPLQLSTAYTKTCNGYGLILMVFPKDRLFCKAGEPI